MAMGMAMGDWRGRGEWRGRGRDLYFYIYYILYTY